MSPKKPIKRKKLGQIDALLGENITLHKRVLRRTANPTVIKHVAEKLAQKAVQGDKEAEQALKDIAERHPSEINRKEAKLALQKTQKGKK